MEIHPQVVSNLADHGIHELFPVQALALDHIRSGRDVVVRSRTGSGKTLAFGIPLAERVFSCKEKSSDEGPGIGLGCPRALVLAPTRELALQVHAELHKLSGQGLHGVAIYGGASMRQQEKLLRRKVDYVVATPGRLVDFLDRGVVSLEGVEMCVLDEADEMLNIGFEEELDRINAYMRPAQERQNVLCSATFNRRIMNVAKKFLDRHHVVDLVGSNQNRIPNTINLSSCLVQDSEKTTVLGQLLKFHKLKSAADFHAAQQEDSADGEVGGVESASKARFRFKSLVFVQEKSLTESLASSVEMQACGIRALAIHGGMAQKSRENALKVFRNDTRANPIDCLIATDVAARGLDIPDVDLVVHFDLPMSTEKFIHRTGRTGRMGKSGTSVLMFTRDEFGYMDRIQRSVGVQIRKKPIPSSFELESLENDALLTSLLSLDAQSLRRGSSLAEKIMQKAPVEFHADILAAALGQLSNKHKHVSYSALSGLANRETLAIRNAKEQQRLPFPPTGEGQPMALIRGLKATLAQVSGTEVDVKRIDVTKDKQQVLVDVPASTAKNLVEECADRVEACGIEIAPIGGEMPPVWRTVESTDARPFHHARAEWRNSRKQSGYQKRGRRDSKVYSRGRNGRGGGSKFRRDGFRNGRDRERRYGNGYANGSGQGGHKYGSNSGEYDRQRYRSEYFSNSKRDRD